MGAAGQTGIPAIETHLQAGNGASPEVYTTIAFISDIDGPSLKGTMVDTTSHSQDNPWRTKTVTLLDAGQIKMNVFYFPSNTTLAFDAAGVPGTTPPGLGYMFTSRGYQDPGVPYNFRIVYPDADTTTDYFQAFVLDFQITAKVADVLRASVTLELTGQPTLN